MDKTSPLDDGVLAAARGLLGWTLVARTGGDVTAGIIVETEAYRAADDPASHAFRGRTMRNDPMWQAPGTIYVYLSYGLHQLLNFATGPVGVAEAVLIRALEPTVGLQTMAARRGTTVTTALTSGPAKLTQALAIDRSLSGQPLGDRLLLRPPVRPLAAESIVATTRIGISLGRELPWRFYVAGSPFVSRR